MPDIAHVVVLMLENRSFDHMLGYLPHPSPDFETVSGGGAFTNPGWRGGPPVAVSDRAKPVLPVGPDHSHDAVMEQLALTGGKPTNQGFVVSYERKCRGLDPPVYDGLLGPAVNVLRALLARGGPTAAGRGPLAMACHPPGQAPALSTLALEFAVCPRWFCSVPGETWPNRNFAHAATSDGETAIVVRPYTNKTIFEVLEEHGASWRIYHDDTPQVWAFPALWDTPSRHACWFPLEDFSQHAAVGDLPAYAFIEPNHRPPLHTLDHAPVFGAPDVSNSQHPENNLVSNAAYDDFPPGGDCDFTRAERLIATVYEALRARPDVFDRTLLVITYDEHGGLYDHVPPPVGVPSPASGAGHADGRSVMGRVLDALLHRRAVKFDFQMLGPRVPAVVVSPHVPAGLVDPTVRDHASIPATLRALFAPSAPPLTARDAWAAPFHGLASLPEARTDLPDLSAYADPRLSAAVSAPSAPAPAAASAAHERGQPPAVPEYYRAFLDLAEQMRGRLTSAGEEEFLSESARADRTAVGRAAQAGRMFAAAAARHRADLADAGPARAGRGAGPLRP